MLHMRQREKNTKLYAYIELLRSFVEGDIETGTFEFEYLLKFKSDETLWRKGEFEFLNRVFSGVDAYCGDDSLRDRCKESLSELT